MTQFNQEHLEHISNIKSKSKAKFAAMNNGPAFQPTFTPEQTQQIAGNSSGGGGADGSVRSRLDAIKNGSMKNKMSHLNEAKSNKNSFSALPEPKMDNRKRGGSQGGGQDRKSPAANMPAAPAPAAAMVEGIGDMGGVESMFDTNPSASMGANSVIMGNEWNGQRDQAHQQNHGGQGENIIPENYGNEDWETSYRNKRGGQVSEQQPQQPQQPQQQYQQPQQQYQQPQNFGPQGQAMQQPQQVNEGYQQLAGPTQISQMIEEQVNVQVRAILSEFSADFQKPAPSQPEEGQILAERVKSKDGRYFKNYLRIDGVIYKLEEHKKK